MKNLLKKPGTIILLLIVIIAGTYFTLKKSPADAAPNQHSELKGTINISGAFALYPLAVRWADEFKKQHPAVRFNISAGGAGKGIADALGGLVDIGLVSRDIYPEEINKGAYVIHVTKDAVLPTFNTNNPNKKPLLERGIKKEEFAKIFTAGNIKNWNQLQGLTTPLDLHIYTRSDAAGAAESWASFFDKKQEDLNGVAIFGDPGLAEAVKKDAGAVGFNNIAYVYDLKTRKPIPGILPIPVDVNGNGKIDREEDFYETVDQLTTAIASGKYPSPPARRLGFLFKGKPQKEELKAFVNYALTEGQKFVEESGYVSLSGETLKQEIEKVK